MTRYNTRPLAERFEEKWQPEPTTGCYLWLGATSPDGYGLIAVNRVSTRAHRVAWELERGPIPPGLQIDHLCRNRACVNPAHLEPVTQQENVRRGEGPQARNRRKTHCASGHEFTAENTIERPRGHRGCRTCYRVSGRESARRARARC